MAVKTVRVLAAVTATLHDGRSMIVLNEGKYARVAEASLPFLREKKAIEDQKQLDHDDDGAPGGSKEHEPPALKGKNKAQLLEIAAAEKVAVADDATNAQIADAIEAKRAGGDDDKELEPVEGHAASVLVSIDDDMFVVNAPWLESPEPFDNAEAAEARQAELREEGPPEGWKPADDGAPGEANGDAAP